MMRRMEYQEDTRPQSEAIEALASEIGQPVSVVAEVYRAELARLREEARVLDFLLLFVARRTREALANASPSVVSDMQRNRS